VAEGWITTTVTNTVLYYYYYYYYYCECAYKPLLRLGHQPLSVMI